MNITYTLWYNKDIIELLLIMSQILTCVNTKSIFFGTEVEIIDDDNYKLVFNSSAIPDSYINKVFKTLTINNCTLVIDKNFINLNEITLCGYNDVCDNTQVYNICFENNELLVTDKLTNDDNSVYVPLSKVSCIQYTNIIKDTRVFKKCEYSIKHVLNSVKYCMTNKIDITYLVEVMNSMPINNAINKLLTLLFTYENDILSIDEKNVLLLLTDTIQDTQFIKSFIDYILHIFNIENINKFVLNDVFINSIDEYSHIEYKYFNFIQNKDKLKKDILKFDWELYDNDKCTLHAKKCNYEDTIITDKISRDVYMTLFGNMISSNNEKIILDGSLKHQFLSKVDTKISKIDNDILINIGIINSIKFNKISLNTTIKNINIIDDKLYINDDISITPYDASAIIQPKTTLIKTKPSHNVICTLNDFYNVNNINDVLIFIHMSNHNHVYDIIPICSIEELRCLLTTFFNSSDTYFTVHASIYKFILIMSFIYGPIITHVSINKFILNKQHSLYDTMIEDMVKYILDKSDNIENIKNYTNMPRLNPNTQPWTNQTDTVTRILTEITTSYKRGLGCSSSVGSGKTLTTLMLLMKLYEMHDTDKHSGFLIIVPTIQLLKGWSDEIDKHTCGFEYTIQQSNGNYDKDIKHNSIVITTAARHRDNYINHNFTYIVVDECLCISDKNSLQTNAVFNQVSTCKYGVLLLSATFFRSTFKQLFQMLKLMKINMPLEREYLDTILSHYIISKTLESTRTWTCNTIECIMEDDDYNKYIELLESNADKPSRELYLIALNHINNYDYSQFFKRNIKNNTLIFAKSESEVKHLSDKISDATIYPDISGKHCIISKYKGSYGLNDLIKFNHIVTRIPPADIREQMKGRLDRFGQTSNKLSYSQLYIVDTIEEVSLIRQNNANDFNDIYLKPLNEIYDRVISSNINRQ